MTSVTVRRSPSASVSLAITPGAGTFSVAFSLVENASLLATGGWFVAPAVNAIVTSESTGVIAVPGTQTWNGRQYKITCTPSVSTGTRTCLSSILSSVVVKVARPGGGTMFVVQPLWKLNSIAYLATPPSP